MVQDSFNLMRQFTEHMVEREDGLYGYMDGRSHFPFPADV